LNSEPEKNPILKLSIRLTSNKTGAIINSARAFSVLIAVAKKTFSFKVVWR
jgi:hypothetical protein